MDPRVRQIIDPRRLAQPLAVTLREHWMVTLPVTLLIAAAIWATVKYVDPAPPNVIRLVGGPEASSFRTQAEKYKKIIDGYGVKVEIVPSQGGLDSLRLLADPKSKADVAFVQGGLTDGIDISHLMSLGNLFVQPLMVYYRGPVVVRRVTELKGKRLAVGPLGSGTRALVGKLLAANNLDEKNSTLLELSGEDAAHALIAGTIDAAFVSGDSVTKQVQTLMREAAGISLMSFEQAEGYRRKFRFLSHLTLPQGAIDIARNYPPVTTELVGFTVELVAKNNLHPALSDLLIAAAQEVHGSAGLYREAGEFPTPVEREFPVSRDAERYYKSGGKVLYKLLPFWLASIADRLLVIFLPVLVLLVPATKVVPNLYRWRVRSRIYRWYGALMAIERESLGPLDPQQHENIIKRLDEIDRAVNEIETPPSFADQLYVLRGHVEMVRAHLRSLRVA